MATNDSNNEWVREGTPREDWDTETDYGVEIHPTEWDDYSDEQAVPVPTPPAAREEYDRRAEAESGQEAPEHQPTADVEGEGGWEAPTIAPGLAADEEHHESGEGAADNAEQTDDAIRGLDDSRGFDPAHDDVADGAVLSDEAESEATQVRERPIVPADVEEPRREEGEQAGHDISGEERPTMTNPDDRIAAEGDESTADEQVEAPAEDEQHLDEGEPTGLMEKPFTAEDQDASFRPADEQGEGSNVGGATAVGAGAAGAAGLASLYRNDDTTQEVTNDATQEVPAQGDESHAEQTKQLDQARLEEEQSEEEARLAKLREQRDARDARLGVVPQSTADNTRVVTKPVKRQSDKFFGALSLFFLRLVTAAIIGALGYQALSDIDGATQFLSQTVIPEPRLVAWILGFGLVAMAALLVLGLGTRLVGFVLLAVAIASLALIRWGQFNIFQDGVEGFLGDRTLLTAASALVLMGFGSGRWGIDGAIRSAREKSKAAKNE